jgi:hypothetical protein
MQLGLTLFLVSAEEQLAVNRISQGDRVSAANSESGLDSAAQYTSAPFQTKRENQHDKTLPVTAPAAESSGLGRAPEVSPQAKPGSSSLAQMAKEAAALDSNSFDIPDPQITSLPSSTRTPISGFQSAEKAWIKEKSSRSNSSSAHGEDSVVSSLSGAGFDQEIVEELHQALNDLKAELEESRAEAARAVKVAEQAIQSAENSNSKDWNSTVTHKAAEAAALAQKRSAEAMAKQRLAEERLEGERRNTVFWRKQAESAEEEAGALQTRAAAASVQREAMAESLESERRNAALLLNSLKQRFSSSESHQRQVLSQTMERNRLLEMDLEACRRQLAEKGAEARYLEGSLSESTGASGSPRRKLRVSSRSRKVEEKDFSSMQLVSVNSVSSGNSFG